MAANTLRIYRNRLLLGKSMMADRKIHCSAGEYIFANTASHMATETIPIVIEMQR
ncbi:MAG: hypothetical protein ACJAQS_001861 [Porticoccus sp.]|jgi:hypothetical protein